MSIISVKELTKTYNKGKTPALHRVSFEVEPGEIFGLIGPDGAGKTTLFRTLATLILPDSGSASVDGNDIISNFREIRKNIGYMPGRFSLYQDLTVEENLKFFATVFNTSIDNNYHLIKDIYSRIEPFKNRRAGKLSGGMKQKLALSCALIHAPRVLFLDEPTTGVDPVSRKEFWEMLRGLRDNFNLTIVVSTPYMDEAMQCDRIGLIQNGTLLLTDTPQGIINQYTESLWSVRSDNMHALLSDLRESPGVKTTFAFGESHHITIDPTTITRQQLNARLESLGHTNISINQISPTIEDCFMNLQKTSTNG